MAIYDTVNGVYRKVTKKYDPVDGVYRNVTKAYDPVDGVYRQYFIGGVPVETLAVGDSVWTDVNGVLTEFLVVHKGRPTTSNGYAGYYDTSCDGIWLLMKDIYENGVWGDGDSRNDYNKSPIHAYLNEDFLGLFDSNIQSKIKDVKIPYYAGVQYGSGKSYSGANGLDTKIFLLSAVELGLTSNELSYIPTNGACLDYFADAYQYGTSNLRIAYYNGIASSWWLRSPDTIYNGRSVYVSSSGSGGRQTYSITCGIRPAFILDGSTLIDQSTGINIIV